MSFDDFVEQLNLKYFRASELLIATDRPKNEVPNSELWGNIVPTILIVDKLRDYLRIPICLTSVYRHPPYNRTIPRAKPRSLHQAFAAADLFIKSEHLDRRGISLETVYEILRSWQDLWFESPVPIQTVPVSIGTSRTPHEDLRVSEINGVHLFRFRGYIARYRSHIHIDTRGINNKDSSGT